MGKSMRPTVLTVVLSAAAALGYLGYRLVLDDRSGAPELAEHGQPGDTAAPPALPDGLPDIMLENLEGAPTPLASWPDKPMVVNFWATWCAPCLREIPLLKDFQSRNAGVQVVGVAVDRLDAVASFAAEMQFNYPILVGQTEAMNAAAALGVEVLALPITVFTDPAGAVLGLHTGEVHAAQLEQYEAVLADLTAGHTDRAQARARLANGP